MPAKYLSKWIWERPEWPKFHWDAARLSPLLAATRKAQGELTGMSRSLDPDSDLQAQLEILTSEGVATSAIEGERFDANALRSSLARRLGLPTAGLPPAPRTVEGLADVLMDATQRLDNALTLKRLASWQAALFPTGRSGLSKIRVGQLRGASPMRIVSGPTGRQRVHYEAPPRRGLEGELERFLDWFNAPPTSLDGVLRAGLAHAWFELIPSLRRRQWARGSGTSGSRARTGRKPLHITPVQHVGTIDGRPQRVLQGVASPVARKS